MPTPRPTATPTPARSHRPTAPPPPADDDWFPLMAGTAAVLWLTTWLIILLL